MNDQSSATGSVTEFVDNLRAGDRVAICGLFRQDGGASRVIQQQAAELAENDYDVTVIALEADLEPPDDVDLLVVNPVQKYPVLSRLYWLVFPLLPVFPYVVGKLLWADVIIAHRYPFTVAGRITSLLSDTHYVYWSHPSGDPFVGFTSLAKIWVGLINWLETRGPGISSADTIVAVSDASREYLSQYVARDILTVQNSVNSARFPDDPPVNRVIADFDIDTSRPVVLYVGRLTQKKNIHKLIDLFETASTDGHSSTLVVTGTAPQENYFREIRTKGGDDVVFTGYVSDAELAALYTVSDVFATCSLEEGWGLPISEATYFGLDVVAFDSHPAALAEDVQYLISHGEYESFAAALRSALNSAKATTSKNSDRA